MYILYICYVHKRTRKFTTRTTITIIIDRRWYTGIIVVFRSARRRRLPLPSALGVWIFSTWDFIAHHIIFSLPRVLWSLFAKCKFGRRIAHIIRAYIYRKYGVVYNMIYRVCILYTYTAVRILLLCVLRRRTPILQNDRTFGRSIRSRRAGEIS